MYADDMVFYSQEFVKVQNALYKLAEWTSENNIHVNIDKTKAIKFRRGGHLRKDDIFLYKNNKIEFTNNYNYLGITLSTKLSIHEASGREIPGSNQETLINQKFAEALAKNMYASV